MRLTTLLVMVAACSGSKPAEVNSAADEAASTTPEAEAPEATAEDPTEVPAWGEQMLAAMDRSADACEDFYQYACGGWLEQTERPADRAIFTRSFSTIGDRNESILRQVLEDAAADPGDDPGAQKLGAFWQACMDTDALDEAGVEPLAETFARIDAVDDLEGLMAEAGRIHDEGEDVLFSVFVSADAKNPDLNVLYVGQRAIGLPDRSYYLDEASAPKREAYQAHIAKMFELAGEDADTAARLAEQVLSFETGLAAVSWERAKLRDAEATYNKLDREGWQALMPDLPLDPFFEALGRDELTQVVVSTPSYFEGMQTLVSERDPEVWRSYLRWRVLSGAAGDLGTAFVDESFDFYGRTLYGQQQQRPRWKRCVSRANGLMGDLLAQQYVDQAFAGESKDVAVAMITGIEAAFEAGLPELAWMDDETRQRAVSKARMIKNKIGYPDTWKTYDFEVAPDDHVGNVQRATAHMVDYWLDKAEQPVDPDEWFMPAPTVNAYYNPSENEIVFPAGILQPPFFHAGWPRAANYGSMGMVMGHEITHGFDDEGRKFTGEGKLEDWWDEAVVERFEDRAECVVDQYSGYTVGDGWAVDGELTLGENIADIGGTRIAYRAYRDWVAENGPEPEVDGLSGEQQFFVAMAQGWCTLASDEVLEVRVKTDSHAPSEWRINGTLRNLPEFAEAFSCDEGTTMAPTDACEVW